MSTVGNISQPAVPAAETVTVKVNGKAVVVPKLSPDWQGKPAPTTMLQAAQAAGAAVPHYCYHRNLPAAGNCRMCLVEFGTPALGPDRKPLLNPDGSPKIARSPRPAISCATPVSPGMEIYTDTPAVKAMREGVLEALLINHPLDCPVCDQAGECKLQEYSMDHGQTESRFVETKVHKPKAVDLGPRILLDAERCILCTRCIRFTRDVVGDDRLGIVNRGSYNTIATYPGMPFDNNYTLNTVDLCPVGALTSKDFRFQMRVWFLKETKSLCTSCGTGCNIVIGSREDRIFRYVPRRNDAVNGPWMCDAGRLNYKWIGHQDRLQKCAMRNPGGGMEETTWSAALARVVDMLKTVPPGSAAIIASARQTNEELFLIRKIAVRLQALTDAVPREGDADKLLVCWDKNPNTNGARLNNLCFTEVGINLPRIADAIRKGAIKALVVFGEDVTRSGINAEDLALLDTLIVSDILPNETTKRAHILLPGCAHAEKRGSFTSFNGRVQKFMKAVEPKGDARPEWEFLAEIVRGLTGQVVPTTIEGLFNQMAAEVPEFNGLTWAGLGNGGVTVKV